MGGNALKNTPTRRYEAAEYHALEREVCVKLRKLFTSNHVMLMPICSYAEKESFGDMDILLSSDALPNDWHHQVAELLESKEVFKNGSVVSFEHREFQIDIITVKNAEFLASYRYFNFNDLGNLLGRIARTLGLKLGHTGLSYSWSIDTHTFRTEIVATDWHEILRILGLDPEPYFKGFQKLEDIFVYVASSTFFNPQIYLLENRNNKSRVRDQKRKTYMEFLDWCAANRPGNMVPPPAATWLPYLLAAIPGFRETYERVQAEWQRAIAFKAAFNGDFVRQVTGLKEKELGLFIRWIKYNNESLEDLVLSMPVASVPVWVADQHAAYLAAQPQT